MLKACWTWEAFFGSLQKGLSILFTFLLFFKRIKIVLSGIRLVSRAKKEILESTPFQVQQERDWQNPIHSHYRSRIKNQNTNKRNMNLIIAVLHLFGWIILWQVTSYTRLCWTSLLAVISVGSDNKIYAYRSSFYLVIWILQRRDMPVSSTELKIIHQIQKKINSGKP